MMGESCLKEDTLMRVLVIGLTRDLPLFAADAMDIADVLVARAANASTDGRSTQCYYETYYAHAIKGHS